MSRFIHIDIFIGDRFIRTLHKKYQPGSEVKPGEVISFVERAMPSLRRKKYSLLWGHFESAILPSELKAKYM